MDLTFFGEPCFFFINRVPPSPSTTSPSRHRLSVVTRASFFFKGGGKSCGKCGGKGSLECPGCKGSGKNKKNGNIFERWKCFDCQGFGLISCPNCGKGGLTPEQRGER